MRRSESKRLLVVGINFAPELTGIGKYTGEMVDWLAANGYDCTVVTGFPYYPHWVIQSPYRGWSYKKEMLNDAKTTIYRCPLFVPQRPTAFRRIIHDASFFLSTFVLLSYMLFKPGHDYIFCVAPPFHLGFLALFYRFFKGGKIIYHIQDLQVDAAKELGIIKSGLITNVLYSLEKAILKRTDTISSISPGMVRKIGEKIDKEIHFFPNWVDTENFRPLYDKQGNREKFGFSDVDRIVMYSGSIGEKQGLEALIDVAWKLRSEPEFKFLICGSGPYKEKIENLAEELKLSNVHFYPLQPANRFNEFSNIADVHLVLQKANASDLVMPSKLSTIFAVGGLALVTSNPGTGLYEEIEKHNIGILIKAEDSDALLEGIRKAFQDDNSEIKENARNYAEDHLSPGSVLRAFTKVIAR